MSYALRWTPTQVDFGMHFDRPHSTFGDLGDAEGAADRVWDTGKVKQVIIWDDTDGEVIYHLGETPVVGSLIDPMQTAGRNFWIDPYGDVYLATYYMHTLVMGLLHLRGVAPDSPHPPGWLRVSTEPYGDINIQTSDEMSGWTQRQLDALFDIARTSSSEQWAKILMNRVRGARVANPLDPEAFSYDALPHRIPTRPMLREDYLGVHTTGSVERSTIYAINKAQVTPDSIGIIYVLDMAGLEPLPDIDAVVQAEMQVELFSDLMNEEPVREAFQVGDANELYDAVEGVIEPLAMHEEGPEAEYTWTDCATSEVSYQDNYRAGLLLQSLGSEELFALFTEAHELGGFPPSFWADVVQQHRYLVGVGLDRVIEVLAVRPVRQDLWGEGEYDPPRHEQDWPEEDTEEPQIFTSEEFHEESWLPDMAVLWSSGREPDDPEYHGTDLTRAQQSFPELDLTNPWPYTQELAL